MLYARKRKINLVRLSEDNIIEVEKKIKTRKSDSKKLEKLLNQYIEFKNTVKELHFKIRDIIINKCILEVT